MERVLIRLGVGAIVALLLLLLWQLYRFLPRSWGKARIGRIVSFSLGGVVVWLVLWLGLALLLAVVPWQPPRWFINALNALIIGSGVAVLAVSNWSLWKWKRDGGRGRPPLPPGGIPDDD